jgi:predicted metal-dependent hydrolase
MQKHPTTIPNLMIDYKVRTSTRSRYVRLSVSKDSGVVVVIPRGFDMSKISEIIVKKEQWIRRSIEKVRWTGSAIEIPTRINLRSIGFSYDVVVEYHSNRRNRLIEENGTVKLSIDSRSKRAPFTLLKEWLREKSAVILLPWLEKISKEHGLGYNHGAVRFQRSRWGSCSGKKNINLNQALVFLRPELVEYLMIHELCHTVEMNHSKKYWELVERHCPGYRILDKELRGARKDVEAWAC